MENTNLQINSKLNLIKIPFKGKPRSSDLVRHLERGDGHLLLNTKTSKYIEGKSVSAYQLEDIYRNPRKYSMLVREEISHKELFVHQFVDINGIRDYITSPYQWEHIIDKGSQADYYSLCTYLSSDTINLVHEDSA